MQAELAGLVWRASERTDQAFPLLPELTQFFPGQGLRRGTTLAITPGPGALSLLLATLAAASQAGSWCAVAGLPQLGIMAAKELGVVLDRLVLVPYPGAEWTAVTSILLDGFDLVAIAPAGRVAPSVRAQLAARVRQRNGSLIVLSPHGWEGAELTLTTENPVWYGPNHGRGRLRCREITINAKGRGSAGRPRSGTIALPSTCPNGEHTCGKPNRASEPRHLYAVGG